MINSSAPLDGTPGQKSAGDSLDLQTLVLVAAVLGGIYLCYLLVQPFFSAVAWAVSLAVLFAPFQHWLETRLKHSAVAATGAVSIIALMVVVPGIFVGQRLFLEAAKGANSVNESLSSGQWRETLAGQPRLAALFTKMENLVDLPGAVNALAAWLSGTAGSLVRSSVYQAIGFCLVFYILFFLLRDRASTVRTLRSYSPLTVPETNRLFQRISDTIHATIYGTLVVAAVQGLLGGLMFWWLDLPAPLLWGVVMGLLAVIPVLGAFVIWVPAAVFLALAGHWGQALLLCGWGLLVVGTVDNLLYPILVGNRLQMPTLLAFFSVVGGLVVFGPVGFVVGPVVLTMTVALLEIWADRRAGDRLGVQSSI